MMSLLSEDLPDRVTVNSFHSCFSRRMRVIQWCEQARCLSHQEREMARNRSCFENRCPCTPAPSMVVLPNKVQTGCRPRAKEEQGGRVHARYDEVDASEFGKLALRPRSPTAHQPNQPPTFNSPHARGQKCAHTVSVLAPKNYHWRESGGLPGRLWLKSKHVLQTDRTPRIPRYFQLHCARISAKDL